MNGHHLSTRASGAVPVAPGVHQHTTEASQQETQSCISLWSTEHAGLAYVFTRKAGSKQHPTFLPFPLCSETGFSAGVGALHPHGAGLWSTVSSGCPVAGLCRVAHVALNHALLLPVFYRSYYTDRSSTKLGRRSVLLCVGSPSLSSLGSGQFAKSET